MKLNKSVRISVVLLIIVSLVSINSFQLVGAAGIIPMARIGEVEKLVMGAAQDKPIMQRISNLEELIYNEELKGSIVERANKIINDLLITKDKPSLLFVLNSIDWSLTGTISQGTMVNRLDELELSIIGKKQTGALYSRIKKLYQMSLSGEDLPAETVTIKDDTLIRIRLKEEISSDHSRLGELIDYEIVNDLTINSHLVLPAGTEGKMRISKIQEAGKMGEDAQVELKFLPLMTIDGSELKVELNEEAQEENLSKKLAIGASLLGTVVLGIPGIVAGYFVEGKEKETPAGSELYIQTAEEKQVVGLQIN